MARLSLIPRGLVHGNPRPRLVPAGSRAFKRDWVHGYVAVRSIMNVRPFWGMVRLSNVLDTGT